MGSAATAASGAADDSYHMEDTMGRMLVIACGGALGAVARYSVSGWVARATRESPFPYGTLTVNLVGSVLLGLLMGATASGSFLLPPRLRQALAVGALGAFTTFSTFSYETVEALRAGDLRLALVNVSVSVALCIAGCWVGLELGQRV